MSQYQHRYSITCCPKCAADLTEPDSVEIDGADNEGSPTGRRYATSLDAEGNLLPDAGGILEAGFHAGAACRACGAALDDYEIREADEAPLDERQPHERILERCSAGPWQHGLHLPGASADGQPCVYGDERQLPLALLDEDDPEAAANAVLMAAAWELCQELGRLVSVAPRAQPPGLRRELASARALLERIGDEVEASVAEYE